MSGRSLFISIIALALLLEGCGPPTSTPQSRPSPVGPTPLTSPVEQKGALPALSAPNARVALEGVVLLRAAVARIGQITQADVLDCSDAGLLRSLFEGEAALAFDQESEQGSLEPWQTEYRQAASGVLQSVERLADGCNGGGLKPDWYGMAAGEIPRLRRLREAALAGLDVKPQDVKSPPQAAARLYGKPASFPFWELKAGSSLALFYSKEVGGEKWCLVRLSQNSDLIGWLECESLSAAK